MRRAKRPLNPAAVKKADAAVAAKTGGRPLTNDPKDAQLRKEWMDAYIAAAGPDSYVDSSKQKPVDYTEQVCREEENWIELEYLYCDGSGVNGAHYTVIDDATGTVAADGYLDPDGYGICELPLACTDVSFNFDKDPDPAEYLKQPIPNPEQAKVTPGWFDRISDGIAGAASWLWGAIQGDFNEDQTIGQVVANTAITMIPVVDQVGDIRDVVANLKFLIWDKRYNDKWVWIALVLTLIGLIPVLGSAAKGILKTVAHGLKKGVKIPLGLLIEVLNKLYKGNAVKWLTEFAADLPKHATSMKDMLRKILTDLRGKLQSLAKRLPGSLGKKAQDAVDSIDEVIKIADDKIDEAVGELQEGLNKSLDDGVDFERKGTTKELNARQQTSTEPLEAPEPEPTKQPTPAERRAAQKLEAARKARREKLLQEMNSKKAKANWDKLSEEDKKWLEADPRRKELAFDPDKKGFSRAEAEAGLQAEAEGTLKPPIERDIDPSNGKSTGGEFLDGDGVAWDHISSKTADGSVRPADQIAKEVMDKAKPPRADAPGENVLVDLRGMDAGQREQIVNAIKAEAAKNPGVGQIEFVPK